MALTGSPDLRWARPGAGGAEDTLARTLLGRVHSQPDVKAYEFLHSDGTVDTLTYRQLYERAAALAARLDADKDRRAPVLLLYPPGLGFVTALWACLMAGVPAVPAYPPVPRPGDRGTTRFLHILADLRPSAVLADPLIGEVLKGIEPGVRLPRLLCPSPGDEPAGTGPVPPLPRAEDVALVQYTSGSTSAPKGVVLRHANLVHNVRAITQVFDLDRESRAVSWLPPYHDMGLIGCVITPVHVGFPIRLMSPLDFLKSPLSWLRQISELGVTATGGPNFAYDLCVRRAKEDALEGLDLSSWKVAFNGAEPVRHQTLTDFSRRFAAHGFRPEAFLPCYGLAEATLIATGRHWDPAAPAAGPAAELRVSCGPAVPGTQVTIVDTERGTPLPDGQEGEILLHGPGVTDGYWGGTSTERLFADVGSVRHLRTGDLGFLLDGELHVTGRSKDVLVHRGVNHHAHDVESAAVSGNPAVRPTAAAFMVDDPEPLVVLTVERPPAQAATDEETAQDLRRRVLERMGVRLDTVVLCPPRAIPKTTSGKVQRALTRELLLEDSLPGAVIFGPLPAAALVTERLGMLIAGVFADVCDVPACSPDDSLSGIGGDSVRAAEIAAVIEDVLHLPVPVDKVLETGTPRALAHLLLDLWASRNHADPRSVARRLRELSGTTDQDTAIAEATAEETTEKEASAQ